MFRYRLRTLLILLAILPPLLWVGWTKYVEWRAEQERLKALREVQQLQSRSLGIATTGVPAPPQPIPPTVAPLGMPTESRPPPDSGPMLVRVPEQPQGK